MPTQGEKLMFDLLELIKGKDYIRENQLGLKIIYGDNYLAVYQGKVVDFDSDNLKLESRIIDKYKDEQVLISTIEDCINTK